MAHFAKIENGIVTQVIVAEQEYINTLEGQWVQTSYTSSIRKNYAGVGFIYDSTRDAFYEPQPYPSWTLNEDTCQWEAPIPYPIDNEPHIWVEKLQQWI
jgi:hypothetical protein